MKKALNKYEYSKTTRFLYCLNSLLLFLCVINTVILARNFAYKDSVKYIKLLSYSICLLFIFVLVVFCFFANKSNEKKDKFFSISVSCNGYSLFSTCLTTALTGVSSNVFKLYVCQVALSFFTIFSYLFYWKYTLEYLEKNKMRKVLTIIIEVMVFLYVFAYILNIKYPIAYYFDNNFNIVYKTYFDGCGLVVFFIFFMLSIFTSKVDIKTKLTLISFSFSIVTYLIICSIFVENDVSVYFEGGQQNFVFLSLLIVFLNVYKNEKEELLISKAKETELQTSIMISQIQPHFIYNTLTAIRALYRENYNEGEKTLIDFANYMRVNMNSIKEGNPIPFKKELEHTKTYLSIEQKRFGDLLNIEYDIKYSDFEIPPLTLQPIVENAVNHGICKNEYGGTIRITTYKDKDVYIVVEDNGPGFNVIELMEENKDHIAIDNVRNRIEALVDGELFIESVIDKGTKVTMKLKGD